tara:strand:- start:381 stop:1109 length:729 start_codon:yes stop_codon:yes gene_type:complete
MKKQKLLGVGTSYKTIKSEKVGVLTGILYMAPYNLSGKNVCPNASAGCAAACLNTSGRGAMHVVQAARLKKTQRFFADRQQFLWDLVNEIRALKRKAQARGMKAAVRLNGTSDLPYEKYKIGDTGKNIMELFPDIQFYDYTKLETRITKGQLPANYHLTFSRAEDNDHKLDAVLEHTSAAVVFSGELPATWRGYPVIDGDEHDARFTDAGPGTVIGLLVKGQGKKDTTGFVVPSHGTDSTWN